MKINGNPIQNLFFRYVICLIGVLLLNGKTLIAQDFSITEIITDYGGYFKSGANNINPVQPDNSHDLLAFTYKDVRYSTGVNDALLTAHGETFSPQFYRALPISSLPGTPTGSTKLALGQMYDGVDNGASNPPPENNLTKYLVDGVNGLNIGTGVANLRQGDITFDFDLISPSAINDGIPDIFITQIADPSNAVDKYEFLDESGDRVGNQINISLQNVDKIAEWIGDFYEASANPPTLSSSFTKSMRPIRIWAADFSDFGITSTNYHEVKTLVIHLSGSSDIAFVAINENSFGNILPVRIKNFTSHFNGEVITLMWSGITESSADHFIIEKSNNGISFHSIGTLNIRQDINESSYNFPDRNVLNGSNFYRLCIVNKDGSKVYSDIIKQSAQIKNSILSAYPNPAFTVIKLKHPAADKDHRIKLFSSGGQLIFELTPQPGTTTTAIDLKNVVPGNYFIQWIDRDGVISQRFTVIR